VHGLVKR